MILWNVQILVDDQWITIATNIRFDYYSSKACMDYIMENFPKLAKKIEGHSWDVEVMVWT